MEGHLTRKPWESLFRISWPECQISPALEMWHDLTILQYLANTKGTALMGKFLALSEFRPAAWQRVQALTGIMTVLSAGLVCMTLRQSGKPLRSWVEQNCRKNLICPFCFLFAPHSDKVQFVAAGRRILCFRKNPFDASAENDLQIEAAGTAAAICLSLLERVIE